jgi:GrpB-like predicted nucleotidyltransferase (UPF0157 family)
VEDFTINEMQDMQRKLQEKYKDKWEARIKTEAAKLYPEDIDKYIEYKSPVIEKIYADMNKELGECRC